MAKTEERTPMPSVRVLIVADDLLVRSGLGSLLAPQPEVRVVGVATTATLAQDLPIFQPDLLLWAYRHDSEANALDMGLPVVALVEDAAHATRALPTLQNAPRYGVLLRDSHPDTLISTLHAVAGGVTVFTPALAHALIAPMPTQDSEGTQPLTTREAEVLDGLVQGLTNKAIAHKLGITDHTVKFHVNAIMTKLNAQSRTDAVGRATRAGLVAL